MPLWATFNEQEQSNAPANWSLQSSWREGGSVDLCTNTAFCLLFDDNPNTMMADAKTHGRQAWEHLSSLDQHLLSLGHLPGSVLGAGTSTTGKKVATSALGTC